MIDELGATVKIPQTPRRIVSLVPSLTETLFALGLERQIVGITKFCIAPAQLVKNVPKVGGTKTPNLDAIVALNPDLVIANAEENRHEHVQWLRQRGFPVYVTYPRSIAGAVKTILALGEATDRTEQASILARKIIQVVSRIETELGSRNKLNVRVFCPVWKSPWMTFNADTYAHDVLRLNGLSNIFAERLERYPRVSLEEVISRRPNLILLPDEPYRFREKDVEELKQALGPSLGCRIALISGRDLHWYGVHMTTGLNRLAELVKSLLA